MTERSVLVLERTRDALLSAGADAIRFVSLGVQLLAAGHALDAVIVECRAQPFGTPSLRLAAHRAMGALEVLFTRMDEFRNPEAYQVLLDIAYG
jgi:hypothetical protein